MGESGYLLTNPFCPVVQVGNLLIERTGSFRLSGNLLPGCVETLRRIAAGCGLLSVNRERFEKTVEVAMLLSLQNDQVSRIAEAGDLGAVDPAKILPVQIAIPHFELKSWWLPFFTGGYLPGNSRPVFQRCPGHAGRPEEAHAVDQHHHHQCQREEQGYAKSRCR